MGLFAQFSFVNNLISRIKENKIAIIPTMN